MTQAPGRQLLAAAAIVGVAVIVASLVLARSLNKVTEQLDLTAGRLEATRLAVADAKEALGNLPAPSPAARRGPDPNRRYTVNTAGSPAVGPATAAVTVVEFSDFQ